MRTNTGTVFLWVLAVVAAAGLSAQQQEQPTKRNPRSEWTSVQQIRPEQKIKVHLANGTTLKGTFLEADANGLVLLAGNNTTMKVPKEEISRIGSKSRSRGILYGAAFGGGLGVGIGAAAGGKGLQEQFNTSRGAIAAMYSAIWAGVGAAIGAATGSEQSLYRAPTPPAPARR